MREPGAPTVLLTRRLRLRRATGEDLAALHAIMSDAETMRYWSTLPHPDLDTTRRFLAAMIDAPEETSDDFVIERGGAVIGKLGAWRWPEVGFIFARDV